MGIAGHGAAELIGEGVVLVEMGATARDLAESVHPHPTMSETLMECAEMFYGHATHVAAANEEDVARHGPGARAGQSLLMPLDNRSISRDKGGQWGATHPEYDPYPPPDADHFASLTHANLPFGWLAVPLHGLLPVPLPAGLTFGAQHDRVDCRNDRANAGIRR